MKKTISIFFLFAGVFMLCSTGYAQINAKTYSFSPFFGGYTFEGNEGLKTRPVSGLRLGYDFTRRLGVEGLFEFVRTKYSSDPISDSPADVYGYRLEALYYFMPDKRLVPYVAAGFGGRSLRFKDLPMDRNHFDVDYGVGLKYFLYSDLAIRGDVRHIFLADSDHNYNNLEYTLGITYYFGGPKPTPIVARPQEQPAPPPAEKPVVKAKPRPLSAPISLTATPATVSQINLGWNPVTEATGYNIYRDGSFVASSQTASLPDTGLNADTRYCYKVTATDGTGRESVQSNQACATTLAQPPPPPPPPVVEKKVPAAAPPVVEKKLKPAAAAVAKEMLEKGRATIDIKFDFNKAVVKPQYRAEIEKFADVMKHYPDLQVVIEGHTDNVGKAAYNQKLSEKRANSVREYMIKQFGIEASRLTAKGYGMTKPIDTNKTPQGRQKNRRVEAAVDYTIKK